jgi:hypothetical protein
MFGFEITVHGSGRKTFQPLTRIHIENPAAQTSAANGLNQVIVGHDKEEMFFRAV